MTWVATPQGAVNLDRVVRVVADGANNGNAYLYLDSTNYVTASLGSSEAEAITRIQQLTRAVQPGDA